MKSAIIATIISVSQARLLNNSDSPHQTIDAFSRDFEWNEAEQTYIFATGDKKYSIRFDRYVDFGEKKKDVYKLKPIDVMQECDSKRTLAESIVQEKESKIATLEADKASLETDKASLEATVQAIEE